MKVVVTGKRGMLSLELQKLDSSLLMLSSEDHDVRKKSIFKKLTMIDPDIIIHAAAITDSNIVDLNKCLTIDTNIIGTANVAKYCIEKNKRLVYISTDYVYPGVSGNYKESDAFLPHNDYAWSKLGGECSVKLVKNHLIIRTSFGSSKFPYDVAWTNHFVSKDYVDIIAPMILKSSKSNVTGVLNIGTPSKSMFEYACKRNTVLPKEKDIPTNFSLNTDRYEKLFSY